MSCKVDKSRRDKLIAVVTVNLRNFVKNDDGTSPFSVTDYIRSIYNRVVDKAIAAEGATPESINDAKVQGLNYARLTPGVMHDVLSALENERRHLRKKGVSMDILDEMAERFEDMTSGIDNVIKDLQLDYNVQQAVRNANETLQDPTEKETTDSTEITKEQQKQVQTPLSTDVAEVLDVKADTANQYDIEEAI